MVRISMAWMRSVLFGSRRWATALVCLAVLCLAGTTVAQPNTRTDELARRHFEAAAAYLEQSEYESALREFQRAHELSGRAEILINVATVHERLGQPDEAITALRRYLEQAPEGEHAETVRVRIGNLRKRLDADRPEPDKKAAAKPGLKEPPPPVPESEPAAAPAPPPRADAGATAPSDRPFWESERLPAYVLFSVAGVSAAGALLTGALAKKEHSDAEEACAPSCSDDELSSGKKLAVTSTVLTGAAVVSAAVGAVLLFKLSQPDESTERARRPTLRVGVAPSGANASATWRF